MLLLLFVCSCSIFSSSTNMSRRGFIGGDGESGARSDVTRILILGDSGVGKSRLVQRIVARLGGECLTKSSDTTVGAHVEAVLWPVSCNTTSGSTTAQAALPLLQLVEIGGNRGFSAAARRPFYQCAPQHFDAAVLVYAERNPSSKRSLMFWFREMVDMYSPDQTAAKGTAPPAAALPPFFIVGVGGLPTQERGWRERLRVDYASQTSRRPMTVVVTSLIALVDRWTSTRMHALLARIWASVVAFAFALSLLTLSVVLLGPSQANWPWGAVPEDAVIAAIEAETEKKTSADGRSPPLSPEESVIGQQRSATTRRFGTPILAHHVTSPFRGSSSDVNVASVADFEVTGEGVIEFVADVVRGVVSVTGCGGSSSGSSAGSGSRR